MSSLGGLGLSHGAEAAVSRLREAAVSLETGLQEKTGLFLKEDNITLQSKLICLAIFLRPSGL